MPLRAPPITSETIDEVNAPPSSAHATLLAEVGKKTGSFRPSAELGASAIHEAGLLTHRSSRFGYLPIPQRTVVFVADRSLFTVARPCGILTRFPFHPPLPTGTSEQLSLHNFVVVSNGELPVKRRRIASRILDRKPREPYCFMLRSIGLDPRHPDGYMQASA